MRSSYYAANRAVGLCGDCSAYVGDDVTRCDACAAAARERMRRLRLERSASGTCLDCPRRADGSRYCSRHHAQRKASQRARARRLTRSGGLDTSKKERIADWHARKEKLATRKLLSVLRAKKWKLEHPDRVRELDRERQRQRRAAAKAAGRCIQCPRPAADGRTRCADHLAQRREARAARGAAA